MADNGRPELTPEQELIAIRHLLDVAIRAAQQITSAGSHTHRWTIIGTWRPPHPIHPRMVGEAITVVLAKCTECGWPETTGLTGVWTEDQIRKGEQNE